MSTGLETAEPDIGRAREGRSASAWSLVLARVIAGAIVLWALFVGLGTLVVTYWAPSPFGRADSDLVEYVQTQRTPTGQATSRVVVLLADPITVVALTTVIVAGLYLTLRRWAEPLFVAICVIGGTLICAGTTAVVGREPPSVVHLDVSALASGFPSWHTAAATCFFGGIALLGLILVKRRAYRRLLWTIAVVAPLAVAGAQPYRGMHFPSDVAAGVLLGALWLVWMTRIYPLGKGEARAAMARA